MEDLDYDVFIAGSGPTGAAYARLILEHHKSARVLMVEVGAQDSPVIGANLKNAVKYQRDLDSFMHIIRAAMQPVSVAPASGFLPGLQGDAWTQPGSRSSIGSPYNPDQDPTATIPAAVTRTVGGMVTHWTCACPEPHDEELVECPIERSTMRKLLERSKKLLNVHDDQFENSVRHQLVKKALADAFESKPGITVKSLPLAGERSKLNETLMNWAGVDTILGDYISAKDSHGRSRFKLLSECLVVKFNTDPSAPNKIQTALVRDLNTNRESNISAKVFVAACGIVCAPQLLWNSNIRHRALGRYLTVQGHAFCQVVLRKTLIESLKANQDANVDPVDGLPIPLLDPEPQITIPYSPEHPFHTQFHRDAFSYGDVGPQTDQRVVVDIRYFSKLELQESNHISFAYEDRFGRPNTDVYGMPQPTTYYKTTAKDDEVNQRMMKEMCDAANVLGSYLPTALPQFIPIGIHAAGTTRVGNDPKTSVADANSRVRKDEHELFENLWVAGMGCIPDSTACNLTLTGVAYAIQGADDVIQVLCGKTFLK